jgi:hypothetical protein
MTEEEARCMANELRRKELADVSLERWEPAMQEQL